MSSVTPIAAPAPQRLISLRQAYELGYGHPVTLRRYIQDGKLRAVKVGNRFKVTPEDLAAITPTVNTSQEAADDAAIERICASAPALTDEQKERLRALLNGCAGGAK